MSTALVEQIAYRLGIDEDSAQRALNALVQQLSEIADTNQEVSIAGLGTFRSVDGVMQFEPTPEMIDAVNHRYAGLDKIDVAKTNVGPFFRTHDPVRESSAIEQDSERPASLDLQSEAEVDDPPTDDVVEIEPVGEAYAGDSGTDQEVATIHELEDPLSELADTPLVPESPDADDVSPASAGTIGMESDMVENERSGEDIPTDLPDDTSEASDAVATDVQAAETDSKVLSSSRKPSRQRNSRAMARMFIPLVAILALVAVLMWVVSRPVSTGGDGAQSESGQATGQTDPAGAGAGGANTPEQTPSESVTDPVPEWTAGQIARDTGAYTIVVSSEESRAEAEVIARSIALRLNRKTDVFVHTANSQTRYRVGVGQYETSDEAVSSLNELSDELPEGSWVLRILPSM